MNDLISRQAAIDLVIDMEFMNNTAKGILRDRLRKLPSAQQDEIYKHGWKDGQAALREEIWERERDRLN